MTKLTLKFSFLFLHAVCLWMEDCSAFDKHDYLEKHRKVGVLWYFKYNGGIIKTIFIGRNHI